MALWLRRRAAGQVIGCYFPATAVVFQIEVECTTNTHVRDFSALLPFNDGRKRQGISKNANTFCASGSELDMQSRAMKEIYVRKA